METIIQDKITSIDIEVILTLDETLKKIMDWDLTRVKLYMINKGICEPSMIDFIEIEYKRFMYLCVVSEDRKVPTSEAVDTMWHTHLIFTKNYISFCDVIRGNYIHHNPTTDETEKNALSGVFENNTLRLYRAYFGEPNEIFWKIGKQICSEVCDDSPGDGQPV